MTKGEKLNRELKKLERQENNAIKSLGLIDKDYESVMGQISFELNRKLNNIEQREARYKKMLDNISKQKKDAQNELKELGIAKKSKDKSGINKFGEN